MSFAILFHYFFVFFLIVRIYLGLGKLLLGNIEDMDNENNIIYINYYFIICLICFI
jgi:hypothetical protein